MPAANAPAGAPAPASGQKAGSTAAPTGGAAGAKAPAGPGAASQPGGKAPAGAPASALAPAGGGVESPFPGGRTGKPSPGGAAVRVASANDATEIPGVPKVALPVAKRSPFRSEESMGNKARRGVAAGLAPSTRPGPGGALRAGGLGPGWPPSPSPGVLPTFPVDNLPPGGAGAIATPSKGPAAATGGRSVPSPGRVPEAPPARLQVTAIIMGQPPMAVIEGEKAHYIVQQGDVVGRGYRVASISLQRVVLRASDNSAVVLRLGAAGS